MSFTQIFSLFPNNRHTIAIYLRLNIFNFPMYLSLNKFGTKLNLPIARQTSIENCVKTFRANLHKGISLRFLLLTVSNWNFFGFGSLSENKTNLNCYWVCKSAKRFVPQHLNVNLEERARLIGVYTIKLNYYSCLICLTSHI